MNATIERTDADWTIEGRAQLGHEILDIACYAGEPFGVDGAVYTGWFARKLGVNSFRQATILRPLMARMALFGVLEKCVGYWGSSQPCHWRLAIDRHEAHERWSDITRQRGWWSGRTVL